MRIILDTDVLVAAVRSKNGASRLWLQAVLRREVELVLSVPLLLQYEEVLTRAEHMHASGATPEKIKILLDALCRVCVATEISFLWRPMLKDTGDEMVLEAAIAGNAEMLLTFNIRDYRLPEGYGFNLKVAQPGEAWKQKQRGLS